jgi:hypothetical protein
MEFIDESRRNTIDRRTINWGDPAIHPSRLIELAMKAQDLRTLIRQNPDSDERYVMSNGWLHAFIAESGGVTVVITRASTSASGKVRPQPGQRHRWH